MDMNDIKSAVNLLFETYRQDLDEANETDFKELKQQYLDELSGVIRLTLKLVRLGKMDLTNQQDLHVMIEKEKLMMIDWQYEPKPVLLKKAM